jgi:hypothetical protein
MIYDPRVRVNRSAPLSLRELDSDVFDVSRRVKVWGPWHAGGMGEVQLLGCSDEIF